MDCCECGFTEILRRIENEGLTPELLQIMTALLPKRMIDRAVQMINSDAPIKETIARTSRRSIWTVSAPRNSYYVFLVPVRFCSCPSFGRDVIHRGSYPLCKHILACCICDAVRRRSEALAFRWEEISDDQFSEFLIGSLHPPDQ
jgi:predicted nucleic acid-binding Zn finger protein